MTEEQVGGGHRQDPAEKFISSCHSLSSLHLGELKVTPAPGL